MAIRKGFPLIAQIPADQYLTRFSSNGYSNEMQLDLLLTFDFCLYQCLPQYSRSPQMKLASAVAFCLRYANCRAMITSYQ
jgi:hypothetical protein